MKTFVTLTTKAALVFVSGFAANAQAAVSSKSPPDFGTSARPLI
jgi:hypothetical protein